jgi:hypothetical protein
LYCRVVEKQKQKKERQSRLATMMVMQ